MILSSGLCSVGRAPALQAGCQRSSPLNSINTQKGNGRLSPAELRKRNNFSLFRTRIASRGDFMLVESNGQKVKIDPTVANTLRSIDDLAQYQVGSSIMLPLQ